MTTNSPNPVDGDVQAHQMPVLTEQQREDALKVALRMAANNSIPSLNDHRYSQLFAEIALAALTTERCGSLIQAVNPQTGSVNIFYRSRGIESIDPAEIAEWEMQEVEQLYTSPPAQLLRPVELPEFKLHSNQPCWPSLTVGLRDKEWIEALRQQGYEVK